MRRFFLDLWLMENCYLILDGDIEWEKRVIVVVSTDDASAIAAFHTRSNWRSIVCLCASACV